MYLVTYFNLNVKCATLKGHGNEIKICFRISFSISVTVMNDTNGYLYIFKVLLYLIKI